MDYSKVDKDGKKLTSIVEPANQKYQAGYYDYWLEDPSKYEPTEEDIKCELQLSALSTVEPLKWEIDLGWFNKEIKAYDDKWVPYLRREGVVNNREGLCLVGLPGDDPWDSLSMPEAQRRTGRQLSECDFNEPTQLYKDLNSIHDLCDYFAPLGRTFLIKADAGSYFPPHRDHPYLTRDCFRICAFLENTSPDEFEWIHK